MLKISTLSLSRPPRKLSFNLRKEVGMITSHFTWLEEYVPHIEQASLELAPDQSSMKDYVKILLEREKILEDDGRKNEEEKDEDDEDDVEADVKNDSTVGFLAMKLNRATMHAYVSDFETANVELQEGRDHLKKHVADPGHQKIFEYFLDAIGWATALLGNLETGQGDKVLTENHFENVTAFCRRWDDFKTELDSKTKALVVFIKGCLGSALKVENKKVLELFVQATKLDPSCYTWFHYAYRKMRQIRQDSGARGARPEGEEIRLCIAAYKLRQKSDVVTIIDYGILLKERWWREPKVVWQDHEKDYLLSQQLFEEALSKAQAAKQTRFAFKAKYYLAELLLFGKGSKLDQFKGRRLLLECADEFPKDSTVLHKIAKLYHEGAFGSHKWKNPVLAEQYYKRAIGEEAENFPCLMGYLSLLKERKDYGQMMAVIDKGLQFGKRDNQAARLYAMKARLLWFSCQRKLACDSWIQVAEKFPDFSFEAYKTINDCDGAITFLETMKDTPKYENKQRMITNFVKGFGQWKEVKNHMRAVDTHRGKKQSSTRKPLVVDRGGLSWSMKAGKGKSGVIRN